MTPPPLSVQNCKVCIVSAITQVSKNGSTSQQPPLHRASPTLDVYLNDGFQQSDLYNTPILGKALEKVTFGDNPVPIRSSAIIRKKFLLITASCHKGTIDYYFKNLCDSQ